MRLRSFVAIGVAAVVLGMGTGVNSAFASTPCWRSVCAVRTYETYWHRYVLPVRRAHVAPVRRTYWHSSVLPVRTTYVAPAPVVETRIVPAPVVETCACAGGADLCRTDRL